MHIYEGMQPKQVIEKLCNLQWNQYDYEEFFFILKNRLRKYTGRDEVMFYQEDKIVELLLELNVVDIKH